MSETAVRNVISQAIYRELLFQDPDKALEGLNLTAEEVAELTAVERVSFDAEGDVLEIRLSRAALTSTGRTYQCWTRNL